MNRDTILRTLRDAEPALRSRGVAHAALFGSTARNQAGPHSDVDIMVEISPEVDLGIFDYVGIVNAIKDLFSSPVDVSNRASLRPSIRPSAERDAIFAF